MFVVQEHSARRLHYDFRLAMEGVLRSWAVPKGPSMNPADKRLAVMVEDHPLDYGNFEGVIPADNYGAGPVILWDRGVYRVIDPKDGNAADAVRAGKLDLELSGFKLHGAFTLVRTRGMKDGKQNWLLIKKRDTWASDEDVTLAHPRSVLSGLTVDEMRDADAVGREISRELDRAGAKRRDTPLKPADFPLSLAKLAYEPFDGKQWLFEIKYDGIRALAIRDGDHVRLYGRSGVEITQRYPEVALAFDALPYDRFVMDGEIVALDERGRPDFQTLQRRMHVQDARTAQALSLSIPVIHFIFDLLTFDGFDLRSLELEKRKEFLSRLIRGEGPIRYCDHIVGRGREFFEAAASAGLEGIVAKRRDAPYRGSRSPDWIKLKCPRVRNFVIGGWSDPEGSRAHFGALLIGLYDSQGALRYTGKVGTGFSGDTLKAIHERLKLIPRDSSPFAKTAPEQAPVPRKSHFVEPTIVAQVRFADVTDDGCARHPSFLRLVENADPRACGYEDTFGSAAVSSSGLAANEPPPPIAEEHSAPRATVTNPDKVFWPKEGSTKADLVEYYRAIAPWMLPYLKDRPVMVVRYPDGIEGKSFYQKDAPEFVPEWIRRESIYSEDSERDIEYFILESAEALAYVANLGTIPIHIWSSRVGSLEHPDWLLFDIDPKGSTTPNAIKVARETINVLEEIGLRAVVKTSGQMGLHVVAGLKPMYTYEQAKTFSELVARVIEARIPELATIQRVTSARKGRVYIDYLQLGYGKTIAAPYAVRPIPGAPVSAPLRIEDLKPNLDPAQFTIKTILKRMERMRRDPFLDAIEDKQDLAPALAKLEALVSQSHAHR